MITKETDLLEELYPVEMKDEFYVRHNLRKSGEGPGGKFNGPSIKYVLREEVLKDLESTLPTFSIAEQFSNYLRSIRELHRVCTAKKLNLKEAKKAIGNFSDKFYNLYMEFELSMTLKTHIIIHHYLYFFQTTRRTMRLTNGEFHESCHSTLRQSEERSNFKVKRKLLTPIHQYKSWQSLVFYNSKRAGRITPLRFCRASSPHTVNLLGLFLGGGG